MKHWVLIRGLTRGTAHWGDFPQRFQMDQTGRQVHLLELPGNGERYRERSPAHVAEMLSDCRLQLAHRGVTGPVHLLALSLGAMVATAWLQDHPDEVAGAVLVNTSMRPFSTMHQRLRPARWPSLLRLLVTRPGARETERLIWSATSARAEPDSTVLDGWVREREVHPVHPANALRQLVAAARFRADPVPPATPLLVLCGDGDRLVDPACSQSLSLAWSCPLRRHASAGHDLPLDAPDWVLAQIAAWESAPLSRA